MTSGGALSRGEVGYGGKAHAPSGEHTDTCKNIAFQQLRLRAVTVHCIGGSNFFLFHAVFGRNLAK